MLEHLDQAKRYLWAIVELGFLLVLAVLLIYLILGESSGVFITSVAHNVLNFAEDIAPQSLVGLALVLALVILLSNRLRG